MSIYIEVGQSIKSESNNFYRILKYIGKGANAYAYRCLCTSGYNKGIEFVLKIQYNLSTDARRERFLRESNFLKTITHPAILQQYDYGTFETSRNSFPFIVTTFMPQTLRGKMDNETIPYITKVKYSCQLLSAVNVLQSQNIIHRDIKPNNIFINNDNAMLGDFGLIKKLGETDYNGDNQDDVQLINETVMSDFEGYVAMAKYYRTPELVNFANNTGPLRLESDIFQLGLVLAELFTNQNPLSQTDNILAPIELNRIGNIDGFSGRVIRKTIQRMLKIDYNERININLAIDTFSGIYMNIRS